MQTSAVTYKIERYTIDQLESKIKTYGKTMSKKKSKKIRKEQAQELSSAEPEHPKLAAEKTAAIASYIKDPDYRLRCKAAIDILMAKFKMINAELSGQKKRTVISQITNRIKSAESIYAKLLKKGLEPDFETARKNLKDLIGIRVVCPFEDELYQVAESLEMQKDIEIVRIKDYIKNPKMSGYRSYHMVYQFHSDKKETYNKNMFIEIQLRTKLQHIWATAVEMMGIYTHSNLKSSQGDEDILRFFTVVSSIFAIQENQPVCPGTSDWLDELLDEMHELDKKHNILKMLEAMKNAAHIIKPKFKNTNGYFLLVLNLEDHNLTITMYKPSEIQIATQVYDTIEARNDPNINAVLVSANSFATVKKAYPNYFVDITDFLNKIKKLYKELETIRQNHKTG